MESDYEISGIVPDTWIFQVQLTSKYSLEVFDVWVTEVVWWEPKALEYIIFIASGRNQSGNRDYIIYFNKDLFFPINYC